MIFNDLSIHGQFRDSLAFRDAIGRIMTIRNLMGRFGRHLHCHRATAYRMVDSTTSMMQGLQSFRSEERQALLSWLTRQGPFWDDVPVHDPGEWFECNDEIVTGTAVAEAAYCSTIGMDRRVVSLVPSKWEKSPVTVKWVARTATDIEVDNYWQPLDLEAALQRAEPPISSWNQLETISRRRFQLLSFAAESFRRLDGHPFVPGAADRIITRLDVLNRLMGFADAAGRRTPEGQRLFQEHFTGDKAWFSDSSDTEKREFSRELTFQHPLINGESLFCTWHGKVNHPPFRIHFSWPVPPGGQLHVVYVGLKITRR